MIDTVSKYNNYLDILPNLISKTYYKAEYFVKALGVSQPTYYRKLRENTFTAKEVTILTKLLFPKEAYLQEIKESIQQGKEDYKNGNVTTHKEVMKTARKIIENHQ